jgi:hypothetical protein
MQIAARSIHTVRLVCALVAFASLAGGLAAAGLSGTWSGSFSPAMNPQNIHRFILDLNADGAKLTGTMRFCQSDCSHTNGSIAIQDGKIEGDTILFGIDTDAKDVPHLDFRGTVTGDSIKFAVSGKAPDCDTSECQIGEGSATRTPPAQPPTQ